MSSKSVCMCLNPQTQLSESNCEEVQCGVQRAESQGVKILYISRKSVVLNTWNFDSRVIFLKEKRTHYDVYQHFPG